MRFVFWLITIPFLALAGAFAAANHDPLTLDFWPFPFAATLPVYVAVIGAFLLGLLLAALLFWAAGLGNRLARRRLARHERALEAETARLRRELDEKSRIAAAKPAAAGSPTDDPARRLIASGDL